MIDGIKILDDKVLQPGEILTVIDPNLFESVPVGTLFIDIPNNLLKVKKNGYKSWVPFGNKYVSIGITPPTNPNDYDLWLDIS